jgi:hypothetical protein
MGANKIIKCTECASALRIPAKKHIKFTCPHCGREFEYINGRPLIEARKRKKKFLTFVGIATLFLIGFVIFKVATKLQNIEETQAYAQKDSIYDNFREKYQYQYQMIGLQKFEDNSCLLIISEPPSHITEESIEDFFDDYNNDLLIKQHRIGYDGWVKDVVVCVNGLNKKKFDKMLSKLQTDLFHTDYKFYTIPLDSMPNEQFFLSENLNVQVSSDELYNWFIKDGEKLKKLKPQDSFYSETKTLSDFFNVIDTNGYFNSPEGIYYSKNTGFVVWILSKNSNLDKQKENARKFAIDSDIILGAISINNYVAIIGREREVSVLELPPLRVETILLLAKNSNKEDGLSQSFEYDNWFLGKQKGEKDWYFAWLCDELINTEYGNLLNWTDHVLKSWTDCNSLGCEYIDFPDPMEYPFKQPLFDLLKFQSLGYNWSSENLTYSFDYDSIYDIQATLGGTGCLPITYIPEWKDKKDSTSIETDKEDSYDYFSNLNNPNIARVVQYQTLYQIFQNCNIRADYEHVIYYNENIDKTILYNNSLYFIDKIISLTDEEIAEIANKKIKKISINRNERLEQESIFKQRKFNLNTWDDWELTTKNRELKKQLNQCENYIDYLTYFSKEELIFLQNYFSYLDENKKDFYLKSLTLPRRNQEEIDMIDDLLEQKVAELNNNYYTSYAPYLVYKNIRESSNKFLNRLAFNRPTMVYEYWIKSEYEKELNKYEKYLTTEKKKINSLLSKYAEYFNLDKTIIKENFICNQNNNINSWVKTPLIVETWNNIDSVRLYGGHNLYSIPNKFRFSVKLKKGHITKSNEGKGIYEIAESEKGNIKSILKTHIKENKIGIRNFYADDAVNIAKNRADVIPPKPRTVRGFDATDHLPIKREANFIIVGDEKIQNHSEIIEHLVQNKQSGKITFENFTINEVTATMTNANVKQVARLKGGKTTTISKEFAQLDFSKWTHTKVGNIIEVKIPNTKSATGQTYAKISLKERFFESIKSIFNRIKRKKDPWIEFKKELKNLNIPENEIKIQIQYEIQNGSIVENHIKFNDNEQRINNTTNIA